MIITPQQHGRAGAPPNRLTAPSTAPGRFAAGPFGAELRPSLIASRNGAYSDRLHLGLLSSKPDVDGFGGVELVQPGYDRQPVELSSRNATHLTIMRPVLFSFFPGADVSTIGLFNDDGELEAFGALRAAGVSNVMPTRVEFASCQVLVKRVQGSKGRR